MTRELSNLDFEHLYKDDDRFYGARLNKRNVYLPRGKFVIMNLAHEPPGSHWVCAYRIGNQTFYFDSFAQPPPEHLKIGKYFAIDKAVQGLDSNLCGYYIIAFLKQILKAKTPSGAKKRYAKFLDMFENLKDKPHSKLEYSNDEIVLSEVKPEALRIVSRRKEIPNEIGGALDILHALVKLDFTKSARSVLNSVGDEKIEQMWVARTPIRAAYKHIINIITLGKFDQVRKKLGYKDIYHLFLIVKLTSGKYVRVEKNETVDLTLVEFGKYQEVLIVEIPFERTLLEFIARGVKAMGREKFFRYSTYNNTCQVFVNDLLKANTLDKGTKEFVMQDAEELLLHSPAIRELADNITDVAAIIKNIVD